jgi:hypothetical protein
MSMGIHELHEFTRTRNSCAPLALAVIPQTPRDFNVARVLGFVEFAGHYPGEVA